MKNPASFGVDAGQEAPRERRNVKTSALRSQGIGMASPLGGEFFEQKTHALFFLVYYQQL